MPILITREPVMCHIGLEFLDWVLIRVGNGRGTEIVIYLFSIGYRSRQGFGFLIGF